LVFSNYRTGKVKKPSIYIKKKITHSNQLSADTKTKVPTCKQSHKMYYCYSNS